MWGRSTTAVRECPRVDVRPSCSSAASCWRRYQVGGGVVGRPRWYLGSRNTAAPVRATMASQRRDYALATFAGLKLGTMEELEDDPSSETFAIELYRPAVYAARTFDLFYVG